MTDPEPLAPWRSTCLLTFLALACLLGPAACDHHGSVNDLWSSGAAPSNGNAVPQARTVQARVNVRLATNAQTFASTDAKAQPFSLSCYALDANGIQVALVGPDAKATEALPVTLNGATTSLDVQVLLPAGVPQSGAGYNLHFALARPGSPSNASLTAAQRTALPHASRVEATAAIQLDAVCGGVQANTPAANNPVDLSIAGSVAYALVAATGQSLDAPTFVQASVQLAAVLMAQQQAIELGVDTAHAHALGDYVQALTAALQTAIVQQPALQAATAQSLASSVVAGGAGAAASQAFANSFSSQVAQLAAEAAVAFGGGANANALLGVFTQAAAAAHASDSAARVMGTSALSPRAVAFTDTDPSPALGGTVSVTPPPVATGVTGYRIYFGDAERTLPSLRLVGQVAAKAAPSLTVPTGTPLPPGASTVWAESLSGTTSLGFVGAPLINRNSYLNNLRATPNSGEVGLLWDEVPNAAHYTIYRSSTGTVTSSNVLAVVVNAQYTDDTVVNGTPYSYAVSYSTLAAPNVEGDLSQMVTATPTVPPLPQVQGVVAAASVESIFVYWPSVPGATTYAVYRTKQQSNEQPQRIAQLNGTTGYEDRAAGYGFDFAYTVSASGNGAIGPPSAPAVAALKLDPPRLDCSASNAVQIACNVTLPPTADHYDWYLGTSAQSPPDRLVASINTPNFTLPRDDGQTYYVAARSVDANGVYSTMSVAEGVANGVAYPTSFAPALVAWGQEPDSILPATSRWTLGSPPMGVAIDNHDTLLVSEPLGNRVHGVRRVRTTRDSANDMLGYFTLGQTDVTTTTPGLGRGQLHQPFGLGVDRVAGATGYVAVADVLNARVNLYGNANALWFGSQPNIALGAADWNTVGTGPTTGASNSTFGGVLSVAAANGMTFVVDAASNRVLVYNQPPSAWLQPADFVLGQPLPTTTGANTGGLNACSLSHPTGAWSDGNRLVVYDAGNARALIWNSMPTRDYKAADVVIGQPDMVSNAPNQGGSASASSLAGLASGNLPMGVASNGNQLALADTFNNRVLLFNSFPTSNGVAADAVLGQDGFTTVGAGSGASGLNQPVGVTYWQKTHPIVTDAGNRRVLMY